MDEGVYAVWVEIGGKQYKGALHFGSVPTFDQKEKTLEVYLLDVTDETVPQINDMPIEIDVVERVRDIKRFSDSMLLSAQIAHDVAQVRKILS
jgi:riboflavin kinase/FMN adenylyltransferase